tara:strand:+ start:1788 stop:2510 length:723 start_codon:yes stop_codon:yes gene_type:complete
MECGEFDKRNREYYQNFSKAEYFERLLAGNAGIYSDVKSRDPLILDVGAHKGESAEFFCSLFPKAEIHSFEPNPLLAKHIRSLNLSNHTVVNCALSNEDGTTTFNIQDLSHLSSIHKVNRDSEQSISYHLREQHQTINVETKRGDTYLKDSDIEFVDLLKMDVQAHEVQALEGFRKCLDRIGALLVEVSFYDFYENKSSIRRLENQIPAFELYDIYEVSKNPKTLGTDWATFVYHNTELD